MKYLLPTLRAITVVYNPMYCRFLLHHKLTVHNSKKLFRIFPPRMFVDMFTSKIYRKLKKQEVAQFERVIFSKTVSIKFILFLFGILRNLKLSICRPGVVDILSKSHLRSRTGSIWEFAQENKVSFDCKKKIRCAPWFSSIWITTLFRTVFVSSSS